MEEVPIPAVAARGDLELLPRQEPTATVGELDSVDRTSEVASTLAVQVKPPFDDPLNRSIWIEGGTFSMGLGWLPGDEPIHAVTVSGFWIQQHKVTNEEFRRFDTTSTISPGDERHPVVGVTWQEAMDYAASLGGTLPTEAQFEFAARGPAGRMYPWGDENPDCRLAHFSGCEPDGLIDVMSRPLGATRDSVHGLASIVYEMTRDWYAPYGPEALIDPVGPDSGERKVLRGGGIGSGAGSLYSANRGRFSPDSGSRLTGFRVVWEHRQGPG